MRINLLLAVMVLLLVFLQVRLWYQADGIHDMLAIKQVIAKQKQENEKLKLQNEQLLFQVQKLKKSQDATEARARNELGMIKKDETFYQILKGS